MDTKEQLESQYGFLYVHIPKTAGRSVIKAFGCVPTLNHKTILQQEKILGRDELLARTKIACVRNPWDRAVSYYKFFHVMLGIGFADDRSLGSPYKKLSPLEFDKWLAKMAANDYTRARLDQFGYLRDSNGEVLIDKLIQFEELETGYGEICDAMSVKGLAMPLAMPKVGVKEVASDSEATVYQKYYQTQESIDLITDLNQDLIKQFGYSF